MDLRAERFAMNQYLFYFLIAWNVVSTIAITCLLLVVVDKISFQTIDIKQMWLDLQKLDRK
jgi:hypothetical protein